MQQKRHRRMSGTHRRSESVWSAQMCTGTREIMFHPRPFLTDMTRMHIRRRRTLVRGRPAHVFAECAEGTPRAALAMPSPAPVADARRAQLQLKPHHGQHKAHLLPFPVPHGQALPPQRPDSGFARSPGPPQARVIRAAVNPHYGAIPKGGPHVEDVIACGRSLGEGCVLRRRKTNDGQQWVRDRVPCTARRYKRRHGTQEGEKCASGRRAGSHHDA